MPLGNRGDEFFLPAPEMLSLDFSYLVRLGLRAPDGPVVVASFKAVDQVLKVDFEAGSLYRRYPGDGYGEHVEGGPYDMQGLGLALLGGERGHLAVCAGADTTPWLKVMLGARGPGADPGAGLGHRRPARKAPVRWQAPSAARCPWSGCMPNS